MIGLIALAFMFVDCLHMQTIQKGFDLKAYLQECESRNALAAYAECSRSAYDR